MENKKKGSSIVVVTFLLCIVLLSSNYAQYQMSPIAGEIIGTFNLSSQQFSSLFTAPMWPAVFLGIIAGTLVDKLGAKKVIGFALILTAAGICLRVTAVNYATFYTCMVLSGVACAVSNATLGKVFGLFTDVKKVGICIGFTLLAANSASIVATATTALFPTMNSAFLVSAVIAVIVLVLWFVLFKDKSAEDTVQNQAEKLTTLECLRGAAKCPSVWIVGCCLMFQMTGHMTMSTYLPLALASRGFDTVFSGYVASAYQVGSLLGCFTGAIVFGKVNKFRISMSIWGGLAAILIMFAWRAPQGILMIVALFLAGYCMGAVMPDLLALPVRFKSVGVKYGGTAGGIATTMQLLGAVILFPYVLTPIAGDNYTTFFYLGGICMLIVIAFSWFVSKDID